jgi:Tol biopolymer transport system component
VSHDAAGQAVDTFAGDGRSGGAIDGDASVVAFSTRARLSSGDTDDDPDVYVRDLAGGGASGGAPALVSSAPAGVDLTGYSCGSPSLSRNGQKVALTCTLPGPIQNPDGFTTVLLHDRATATTSAVNRLTALPEPVHVSGDGRYVTFTSTSGEVPGDTNGAADVFVRDLAAGTTVRVSVTGAGAQANGDSDLPDISADGRYVVFQTVATNLVAGDTFGTMDVFVHDRDSDDDGIYDEPGARTTTLADVTTTGSRAGESYEPAISDDGHIVAFSSDAGGVVPNDTNGNRDVFVRNMTAGTTTRVSTSAAGAQTPDHSSAPRLAADGQKVAFRSGGPNLVDDDRNGLPDVFVTSTSR